MKWRCSSPPPRSPRDMIAEILDFRFKALNVLDRRGAREDNAMPPLEKFNASDFAPPKSETEGCAKY